MHASVRPLATILTLVCACTGANEPAAPPKPAPEAAEPEPAPGPDPWARAPAGEGDCRWAGLRFSVDDFVPAPESYFTNEGAYCINYSGCEWNVQRDPSTGETAIVEGRGIEEPKAPFELPESAEFVGRLSRVRVSNGWLLGFDRGEFGGSLYWFSSDGQRNVKIADDLQIDRLFELDGEPYAITSINHMRMSEGAFIHIVPGGRHGWDLGRTVTLPRGPLATALKPPRSVVVVDDQGLYTLDLNGHMNRSHGTNWYDLRPYDAELRDDGSMVLSGRHIIIDLKPSETGWTETVMVPPACTTFRLDDEKLDCICG